MRLAQQSTSIGLVKIFMKKSTQNIIFPDGNTECKLKITSIATCVKKLHCINLFVTPIILTKKSKKKKKVSLKTKIKSVVHDIYTRLKITHAVIVIQHKSVISYY